MNQNNTHHQHHDHAVGSHKACISLVPIFNHLEEEQLDEIMVTTQSISYKKNELIYHAGEESDSLYIINKGKISLQGCLPICLMLLAKITYQFYHLPLLDKALVW